MADTTQHQYTNAVAIYPNASSQVWDAGTVDASTFTATEAVPPGVSASDMPGYYAAWWKFTPASSDYFIYYANNNNAGLVVRYWSVDSAGTWTLMDYSPGASGTVAVTAGNTYYLRLACTTNTAASYTLHGYGPAAVVVDTSAHQWNHALVASPAGSQYSWDSTAVDTTGYTAAEANPTGATLPGYRALWASYVPSTSGTGIMVTAVAGYTATAYGIDLRMWSVIDGTWTSVKTSTTTSDNNTYFYANVTGGVQYYIRAAATDNSASAARIQLLYAPPAGTVQRQPLAAVPVTVVTRVGVPVSHSPSAAAVPIVVTIGLAGHITGDVDVVEAAPVEVAVSFPTPGVPAGTLVVPPVRTPVHVPPPDLRRIVYGILEPSPASRLPVTAPALVGYVNIIEGDVDDPGYIGVDFEYGQGFEDAYQVIDTIRVPVEIYTSYTHTEVQLPTLTAGTYYWRMRLVVGTQVRPWTVLWSFTVVGPAAATATLPVTAVITAAATYPVIWHIEPPVGAPGDQVTLYGSGFPADETGVTFGEDMLDVVSWTHVPATAAASTAARQILDAAVDPEHDEIVVIVPDTESTGDSVTVLAEDD